ncbi:hypothetical protein ONS95_001318 [Cadophora gregata]|uniref:uncharacterized protein n=1 Tax=Cadophora gregata TaxID=51156 RepID=UPI0026DC06E1|nr:uncharacterized protein ONS95_001318 [Cadophora gregata]KAK0101871.1 hypothetical protein ONS96_005846 [Cadophora gregata f. sp. sojae]KAK0129392.1 hypothetical protein ONS95_001318 [Cadophora gregata]
MAPIPIPTTLHILPRTASPSTTNPIISSLSSIIKRTLLQVRQSTSGIIPTTYGNINDGPAPGTVVGIVLGSVGGFLLILWLIYTCMQFGSVSSRSSYTESIVIAPARRKSHHGSTTHARRVSETVEVRRAPSPVRIVREPSRVDRVIVEESRETRRERSRSLAGGSDEVVVIEEHSPPRRKKSTRVSAETERRESGYRTVDPGAYGGAVGGRKVSGRR